MAEEDRCYLGVRMLLLEVVSGLVMTRLELVIFI